MVCLLPDALGRSWVWTYLPIVLLGPCLATLVTHWHHETTRQMLWGTVDYLTVDELNFVVVPLVFAGPAGL